MNKVTNKSTLAKELGVSRSSLYYHPKMPLKDELLKEQILATLDNHPAYGHKRIALHLGRNKKCILRVMKKFKITPLICRRKKPVKPDDLGKKPSTYCNVLKHMCPIKPDVIWASDFTYLNFHGRFYYFATIIDVFSREIVGTAFGWFHNKELVMEALENALSKYSPPDYIHSDQGSEYKSEAYENLAKAHGIQLSMSAKSKPWQNAFQESFYSQFKLELGSTKQFQTLGELVEALYLQIHYYNNKRIHTSLKMPPITFAKQYSSH
jgi:transposase InsO family protein